jgi:hypothetical protein
MAEPTTEVEEVVLTDVAESTNHEGLDDGDDDEGHAGHRLDCSQQ